VAVPRETWLPTCYTVATENGECFMASLVNRLAGVVCAFLLMVGAAAAFTLNSDEGRFTIELIDKPAFEKLHEKTAAGYFVDRYQWLLDQGEVAWIVTYGDYPEADVKRLGAETMYDNGAKGSVDGVKGQLQKQEPIQHSGVRGRELFVTVPEGNMVMRQRLFLVGTRLYQNVYVGPAGTERNGDVEVFFKSFEIRK
jgi:hypothetical protein